VHPCGLVRAAGLVEVGELTDVVDLQVHHVLEESQCPARSRWISSLRAGDDAPAMTRAAVSEEDERQARNDLVEAVAKVYPDPAAIEASVSYGNPADSRRRYWSTSPGMPICLS
jgi:hypothetical protein